MNNFCSVHCLLLDGKKGKKKKEIRWPARLFNPDEFIAMHGEGLLEVHTDHRNETYYKWDGMTFKDGFIYKVLSGKILQTDAKPTLEDIKNFTRVARKSESEQAEAEDELDEATQQLQAREKAEIAFARKAQQLAKKSTRVVYNKGDLVQVFEGELKTLIGTTDELNE